MTLRPGRLLAGILLTFLLALPATAQAVTVNLRIEGATRTLFQGAVNAEPIASLSLPSSGGPHPCDVRANTGDPGDPVAATPFGALVAGAQAAGLSLDAAWFEFGDTGDFLVREVGGDQATDTAFWGFAVNYAEAMVGGCQIPLAGGEQVLYAYDYFSQNELLTLSGPTVMNVGEHAQFLVRNGRNNVGVTGAAVAGSTTHEGVASVSFSGVGVYDLQATKPGALRSNVVRVCVHDGNDGNCGFPDERSGGGDPTAPPAPAPAEPPAPIEPPAPQPPIAPVDDTAAPQVTIAGLKAGRTYRPRRAPRELRGRVADAGGIRLVELRLKRRAGKRCWSFDGEAERFRRQRCAKPAAWFGVGSDAAWSYLLPARLPSGRYVLDARATDAAGNVSDGERVRFRVA